MDVVGEITSVKKHIEILSKKIEDRESAPTSSSSQPDETLASWRADKVQLNDQLKVLYGQMSAGMILFNCSFVHYQSIFICFFHVLQLYFYECVG